MGANELAWKTATKLTVDDEKCPECGQDLKYDNGLMVCSEHGPMGTAKATDENDKEFDWNDYDFSGANPAQKKVQQPKWKWSYDGHKLLIWPVDENFGRPHHIEVTGMDFWKLAQGRVYVEPNGDFEILVWEDRGTQEMQDEAIEAVDAWLEKKTGKGAKWYSFQSEGGVYQNLDPENPDKDAMMSAYFGYPVKTKTDGTFEPADQHDELDQQFNDAVQSD